jgi:hypothetical protein
MAEPRMNTDGKDLKHYEITRSVIGIFYQVYNELGQGFLEAVYVEALYLALRAEGLSVYRELPIKVHFLGLALLLNFGRRPQFRRLRFDNAFKCPRHHRPIKPGPGV